MSTKEIKQYTNMQKNLYEQYASSWGITNRDPVVGSFDAHNAHKDYEDYLFKDCTNFDSCLDFGCGPGRNIVKFRKLFDRFDGVDISKNNLSRAESWIKYNNLDLSHTDLFLCNGYSLENILSNKYDVVMSTITLQHICVHTIRFNYFKEFFRVLKPGGRFVAQMGFGSSHPASVGYYEDNYDANETNGGCDTRVEDIKDLKLDLEKCGFTDFKYYIRPVGPGDRHSNWVFFSAKKEGNLVDQ